MLGETSAVPRDVLSPAAYNCLEIASFPLACLIEARAASPSLLKLQAWRSECVTRCGVLGLTDRFLCSFPEQQAQRLEALVQINPRLHRLLPSPIPFVSIRLFSTSSAPAKFVVVSACRFPSLPAAAPRTLGPSAPLARTLALNPA
eukprot:858545-Pleurochrysis_carterae.AAC.3